MHDIIADREREFTEQVEALLKLGRAELNKDYGSLSEIRDDEYHFKVIDADDEAIQAGDIVPLSSTNCEITASSEQTLVLGDLDAETSDVTDREGNRELDLSCYIGAPVFVGDDVYGTFCFYGTDPRDEGFSEWEITLVNLMSRWVGYELQRQQDNERLQRQNEQLEQFASIVSHDLRNPLNVLEGRLQLAEETGDAEEFVRCRNALDRMNTLIDDLLTLARSGAVIDGREPIALEWFVTECWQNVSTGEATLRVETDRTMRADTTRLRQLLENLLRNAVEHGSTSPASQTQQDAVEHGSPGSRSEAADAVERGSTSPQSQTHEDIERDGSTITVTVIDIPGGFAIEDDGPGIPADTHDEIFEAGYTTRDEGTGFGLAIVREVAEAHGWEMDVTESADGGVRFEFTGISMRD